MKKKNKYADFTKKGLHIQYLFSDIIHWIFFPQIWLWQRPIYKFVNKDAKKTLKPPFMVIGNHQGFSDFLFVYYAWFGHRLWWLVTDRMFETKFKAWLYKRLLCAPVNTDNASLSDVRLTLDILKANNILVMYPEGHINFETSATKNFKGGATVIALQSGVETVPVYRERRKHWWNRQRIIIGEPYNVKEMAGLNPSRNDVERINNEIYEKELELKRIYQNWAPAKKCQRNNVQVFVSPRTFECNMKVSSKERMEEIERTKDKQSKIDKIYAWKVLERVFREEYGENINQLHLHKLDSGKWSCDKYHISISHSGELIAVAIGKYNCGVDIQSVEEMDFSLDAIELTLNEEEKSDTVNKDYLVKNWSVKEAKYKLDGISGFCPKNMKLKEIENAESEVICYKGREYRLSVVSDTKDIASYHFLEKDIDFKKEN